MTRAEADPEFKWRITCQRFLCACFTIGTPHQQIKQLGEAVMIASDEMRRPKPAKQEAML